ncbi:MAG: sugar phosphate isomerase/epimerase family protein [Vicinamibacterales bacterium]
MSELVLPLAAITDEFSPTDLDRALDAMAEVGMTGAELRIVWGRNIMDLSDQEIDRVRASVESRGMQVLSIASPVLKCVLPDAPPVDPRLQQDTFAASFTFADQPALAKRAFEIAERSGARMVRVFSYWRSVDPDACFGRVASALQALAEQAGERGLIIGIENEHACNISTGEETARLLESVATPSLQVIWDPANALVAGETPFPFGYRAMPASRIGHVHAKDCDAVDFHPTWGELGAMSVDWTGQIQALVSDGYRGYLSLETHWKGPHGDKFEASQICGRRLRALVLGDRVS